MFFIPFLSKFGDIAEREMAMVEVKKGAPVPASLYAFIENYCTDSSCDCRRVMINVFDMKKPSHEYLATIDYGWESVAFYTKWMRGNKKIGKQMAGSSLSIGGKQSKYSRDFLELWKLMLKENKEYEANLKKHYLMFKKITNFENTSEE
jgi:hypothetical protein